MASKQRKAKSLELIKGGKTSRPAKSNPEEPAVESEYERERKIRGKPKEKKIKRSKPLMDPKN